MPGLYVLDLDDLRAAHAVLAEVFEGDPEPVPGWYEGNRPKLATIAGCTEVSMFGHEKYPDLPSKAAKLFYSAIKVHAFPNGNKRFALVLTLAYFVHNGHRLMAAQGVGAEVARRVADSDPHSPSGAPDTMVEALAVFFKENVEAYDWAAHVRDAPNEPA